MAAVRIGIVGVVAVTAGAVGLAISGGAGTEPVVRTAGEASAGETPEGDALAATNPMAAGDPYWGNDALPPIPAPPGKTVIAFNDGGVPGLAGYTDDQGPNGWDVPDPVLDLGTGRYELRGVEITDLDGVLLGYAIGGVGLVDVATARNPELMDALMTEADAEQQADQPMTEEEIIEMFGDPGDGGG